MYGRIGTLYAAEGQRDELVAILLEAIEGMAGCRSYIVSNDSEHGQAIWITEVWDSAEHHAASLKSERVQLAIARAMPIIAGFGEQKVLETIGGIGLQA
jgi:quinol monooxygenase YgiN